MLLNEMDLPTISLRKNQPVRAQALSHLWGGVTGSEPIFNSSCSLQDTHTIKNNCLINNYYSTIFSVRLTYLPLAAISKYQ